MSERVKPSLKNSRSQKRKTNIRIVSLTLVESRYSISFAIIFSRNCISVSPSLFTVAMSTLLGNIIVTCHKVAFGRVVLPLAAETQTCRVAHLILSRQHPPEILIFVAVAVYIAFIFLIVCIITWVTDQYFTSYET